MQGSHHGHTSGVRGAITLLPFRLLPYPAAMATYVYTMMCQPGLESYCDFVLAEEGDSELKSTLQGRPWLGPLEPGGTSNGKSARPLESAISLTFSILYFDPV